MNPMPALTPNAHATPTVWGPGLPETRNRQAIEEGLFQIEFLAIVSQDDVAWKTQKRRHQLAAEPTSNTVKPRGFKGAA